MNNTKIQQKPYTQVVNSLLNDTNISLKAKGLYAFMDSKPSGWNFTIVSMSKQLLEGTDAIKSGLRELKENGYISYTKKIDGHGEYLLTDGIAPKVDYPRVGNPKKGKPTRISKKEPLVRKIYRVPTLEEIAEYIKEKNYNVDSEYFYSFYASNDWKDTNGKQVKNWKQKIISWNSRNKPQVKDEGVQLWG